MTLAQSYDALARMLDYPGQKEIIETDCESLSGFMSERGLACPIAPFAGFVAAATLAALQEQYVATFDFNPALAPYLGHHLYGDNQKKGSYMIKLKQEYVRYGFSPLAKELPDHLPLVLSFLAHLAQQHSDTVRENFISDCVLPGVERLLTGFAGRHNSPWEAVVETARSLCAADNQTGKEEKPC